MPFDWEPWPGNRHAIDIRPRDRIKSARRPALRWSDGPRPASAGRTFGPRTFGPSDRLGVWCLPGVETSMRAASYALSIAAIAVRGMPSGLRRATAAGARRDRPETTAGVRAGPERPDGPSRCSSRPDASACSKAASCSPRTSSICEAPSPPAASEGLLGLAFAPDYATSGRFFVCFTDRNGHIVVARFKRLRPDPLRADPQQPIRSGLARRPAVRRPSVQQPQRRQPGVRPRRIPVCRDGRRRIGQRSAELRAEPALAPRQDA